MKRLPLVSISALSLLLAPAVLAPRLVARDAAPVSAEEALRSAWQTTTLGLYNNANLEFAALEGDEARLGEAVTLLLRQPKTDGNVNRAVELLAAIAEKTPDSTLGISAKYYLGRIEQTHRTPADPEAARRLFRDLVAKHAGHPYADLAAVKLAILDLYEQVPDTVRRSRFDEFAALAPTLKSPPARRDLNLLLADIAQRFGYDSGMALDFLLAAEEVGVVRRTEQAHTWVRIGRLAEENGRYDVALDYYNKYLKAFARDNRRRMVMERLAALPAASQEAAK